MINPFVTIQVKNRIGLKVSQNPRKCICFPHFGKKKVKKWICLFVLNCLLLELCIVKQRHILSEGSWDDLLVLVESLMEEVKDLKNEIVVLNSKISVLEKENALLKVKKTSVNSSIAPSADITNAKSNQSLREKSGLKKRGQLGHIGHTLEMTSTPDEIINYVSNFCSD